MSWDVVKLIDICTPKQWKTISSSGLLPNGYPVYGANGKIGFYNTYTHEHPTVMITCRGATCGTINISDPKSYINGNAMALDNLKETVHFKYLFYYLSQYEFKNVISGSAQPQITGQGLQNVTLPLPPLHIQEQIADTLDKADALRKKDEELLIKYDELAQAIFYDMFGDPVKNEKGYKIATIEDISVKVTDGEHSTPQRVEAGIKLLSARNIKNGYIDFDAGLDYIPESEFIRISKRCNPELNDILISCSGTIGRISAVRTKERFGLVRSVALVKYKQDLLKRDYLEFFMQTDYFQKAIWRNVNTSSQSNLFTGQLKKLPVLVPPLDLQSDFEKVLYKLFKSKEICKNEKSASSNLYQSLMYKFFS